MNSGLSIQAILCCSLPVLLLIGLGTWLLIRARRNGELWNRGPAAGKTRSQEAFDVGRPPPSAPPTPPPGGPGL